jgi:methyl-accepting chemotaxis protein
MVEEASAAAGSLEDQSRALGDAVSAFRLASDAQGGGARRPVPEPTQAQPQAQPQAPMLARDDAAGRARAAEAQRRLEAAKAALQAPAAKASKRRGDGDVEEEWREI